MTSSQAEIIHFSRKKINKVNIQIKKNAIKSSASIKLLKK